MDIRKLGLSSTIAILSTTIFLGGCDLFKSPEQLKAEKIARLSSTWEGKSNKFREAQAKLEESSKRKYELLDKYKKEFENNEFVPGLKEAVDEEGEIEKEYDKAYDESQAVWNKLRPYLQTKEYGAIATNCFSSG
ncbi:hypothetical protein C0030_003980 [Candidatus Liberibacter solanacearum]|uniref:Lipoprotein n=1 Tax=Candidatus Liberibacter solanacearum TaxID=556287 RepID=A0A424FLY5_9HYPH|nr:hypothetical protein [Candidatus Liberibacter solanacearum]RPD37174.1 hypothetical protein C0030_003980 [Candidatus Liberibacter solanacearum]